MSQVLLFTQPGCLSCELMRVYLEAREITFEERDISVDFQARLTMSNSYKSNETPTLVIIAGASQEVITGFDPVRLDQLLTPAPSSESVPRS